VYFLRRKFDEGSDFVSAKERERNVKGLARSIIEKEAAEAEDAKQRAAESKQCVPREDDVTDLSPGSIKSSDGGVELGVKLLTSVWDNNHIESSVKSGLNIAFMPYKQVEGAKKQAVVQDLEEMEGQMLKRLGVEKARRLKERAGKKGEREKRKKGVATGRENIVKVLVQTGMDGVAAAAAARGALPSCSDDECVEDDVVLIKEAAKQLKKEYANQWTHLPAARRSELMHKRKKLLALEELLLESAKGHREEQKRATQEQAVAGQQGASVDKHALAGAAAHAPTHANQSDAAVERAEILRIQGM
jgi:hypothetical protein